MDEDNRRIKKFRDFVSSRKYSRSLSHLIIQGKTKKSFFFKSVDFEIHVYFTPMKKIIMEISSEGIDLNDKRLNLTFKTGNTIDLVYKWVEDNGHEIIFEMLR
jgi:citrate lyase synthetase